MKRERETNRGLRVFFLSYQQDMDIFEDHYFTYRILHVVFLKIEV